jgi:hypothetical protein
MLLKAVHIYPLLGEKILVNSFAVSGSKLQKFFFAG